MEDRFECPECGKAFSSEDLLERHARLRHSSKVAPISGSDIDLQKFKQQVTGHLNKSFFLGLIIGILLTTAAFSGFMYWNSLDHRVNVPVKVVTCENCSYDKFRTATERMFKVSYTEVNYKSEKGQKLIDKYNIHYVPAFIFDDKIEKAEAFHRVKSVLVKFKDAYVMPDKGVEAAQRLSSGRKLKSQHR